MKQAVSVFFKKFWEALVTILPIFFVVLILGVTIVPLTVADLIIFFVASLFLVFGMFLFTNGAESSMILMGQGIGSSLSKSRKILIFLVSSFVLGAIITVSEPDLMVLAGQIASINKWVVIATIGAGAGFFCMLAVLRIIFQVKIKYVLLIAYSTVLLLLFFIPQELAAVAFDASGVTTGPISSPFILAFGLGVSAVRASKKSQEDSFGLIGIVSIGPILFVELLGVFMPNITVVPVAASEQIVLSSAAQVVKEILKSMLNYAAEVGVVILAIMIIFFAFNAKMLKLPKNKIRKILVGIVVTYVGIILYLTGVNVGYLPISYTIGTVLTEKSLALILPILAVIGAGIIVAEPAVHVLVSKVYQITDGAISKKIMFIALILSMVVGLVLSYLKVYFNISFIAILVPIFIVILVLLLFAPQIFIAIAFDSGGVASGPMATSFLLPLTIGAAAASGTLGGGFGTIALISAMPLLTVQVIGVLFKIKQRKLLKNNAKQNGVKTRIEIMEFAE